MPRRASTAFSYFRIWGGIAIALASLAPACHSDARRAEQARVAHLAERIDRLRRADNHEKNALLELLERTECVGPEACGLKDLCVRAYKVHQRALDAIETMKKVAASDAGPSVALRERLHATEQDLTDAKDLSARCAEEQVRTMRKTLM
jgi:hypothetical protein